MNFDDLLVGENQKVELKNYPTEAIDGWLTKPEAEEKLAADAKSLSDWQEKLYAQDTYALLVILQGIDASGKDSTIRHVFSQTNPTGCRVSSFKAPSENELEHDYLWRHAKVLPERGTIGVFNRSYYEEVLVVRVHPELLKRQKIPAEARQGDVWQARFEQINGFERYLVANGIEVVKFFLHLSKQEQKQRFLKRLDNAEKHWKFSEGDVAEREHWDDYTAAYEDMLSHTSSKEAPWHIIPADQKWFARAAVASIVVDRLASLEPDFPRVEGDKKKALERARKRLEAED